MEKSKRWVINTDDSVYDLSHSAPDMCSHESFSSAGFQRQTIRVFSYVFKYVSRKRLEISTYEWLKIGLIWAALYLSRSEAAKSKWSFEIKYRAGTFWHRTLKKYKIL
jgi:hypothetical protein